MIRPATVDDIPRLIEMGRNNAEAYGAADQFEPDDFRKILDQFIANAVVLTDGRNCMAGVFTAPWVLNLSVLEGNEQFMWIEPEARGWLWPLFLDAIETWAGNAGAAWMNLGGVPWMRGETVGRLYRRSGYETIYNIYRKRL